MARFLWLACVAALVCVLDQVTKALVLASLPEWRSIPVIPGCFDLVHIRNRGAAFGFLNRSDIEWQFWLFLAATVVACAVILYLVASLRERAPVFVAGLGAILGGALGNTIDRIRFRAVVDFLDVYWNTWHWPAFNVADIAICLGALVVGCVLCFGRRST